MTAKMKRPPGCTVPVAAAACGLCLGLAACLGPDLQSGAAGSDPLVVHETSDGSVGKRPARDSIDAAARSSAVADIRSRAEAAERALYPDVFQSTQNRRLAARPEPRSVDEAGAIAAELDALAALRLGPLSPGELARLDARARELRRLAAQAEAGRLRK